MDLRAFLQDFTQPQREAFAVACGTTIGHLNNVVYRQRKASASLAMQVEIESNGVVTRRDLRPDDCELIWPDLAGGAMSSVS